MCRELCRVPWWVTELGWALEGVDVPTIRNVFMCEYTCSWEDACLFTDKIAVWASRFTYVWVGLSCCALKQYNGSLVPFSRFLFLYCRFTPGGFSQSESPIHIKSSINDHVFYILSGVSYSAYSLLFCILHFVLCCSGIPCQDSLSIISIFICSFHFISLKEKKT